MNRYTRQYIEQSREWMEAQIAAYRAMACAAKSRPGSAAECFEPLFFNNMVVVLDAFFAHRTRALEQKNGNPMNEVRMLSHSILQNQCVLAAEKATEFRPERTVLKLEIGDEIQLREADFMRLFRAFFAEIGSKFAQAA